MSTTEKTEGFLLPIESINAIELFTGHKLDDLLNDIRKEVINIVPNVDSVSGRKEIASLAYKVARSKTAIDDAGKELVAEWKKKAASIDAGRKKARDYLDELRDQVRKPLTDWENEQARIEQEQEAARLAEIERREAELKAKEEAIAAKEKAEAERIAKEQAEQERVAREARIADEARLKAERDAAEAIANAQRDAELAKEQARFAAEKAEADRIRAIKETEERARQEAINRENERLAQEAKIKAEAELRAANIENRRKINNAAVKALIDAGINEDIAKQVITLIASKQIPHTSIIY